MSASERPESAGSDAGLQASIERGLGQSAAGETHDLGSFAEYLNDDPGSSPMTHVRTYTYVTFANPNLRCDECGGPVARYRYQDSTNDPCRHWGVTSECPSWGPVDGCRCEGHPHQDCVTSPELRKEEAL